MDEFRARNRNPRSHEGLPSPLPSTPSNVSILRRNTSSNQQQSQEPAPTVSEDIPRKICSYCKNFGHLLSECLKRMYHANNPNNSRNPNNNNYSSSRNNFNLGNNSANNGNTNNSYGHAPSGNSNEASPSGASRGLGTPRPAFPLEATLHPVPSTSSRSPQEMSPPSN